MLLRAAGIPAVVSSQGVSEVIPLPIIHPIIIMAIMCVWATYCSSALKSALDENAPEPVSAIGSASEPASAHKSAPELASTPKFHFCLDATTEVVPESHVRLEVTMEVALDSSSALM